jgi:glycosyltransferase involved in cell wall biosynthesis
MPRPHRSVDDRLVTQRPQRKGRMVVSRHASRPAGIKVIHLSSVHHANDSRIYWKECMSLARAGYDVTFVVPDDHQVMRQGAVDIVAVPRRSGRLARMLATTIDVVIAGLRRNGLIYHFHDPELIPAGLLLRILGKRVIYDVHEDVPRNLLIRGWIPRRLRRPVAFAAALVEWVAGRTLSGFVAATPTIARRFPEARTVLVQNFASKSELVIDNEARRRPARAVAYVGSVTAVRCAMEVVEAIAKVKRFPEVHLVMAGEVSPPSLMEALTASPGWSRVDYRGYQDRPGIRRLLAESRVGLALYHPVQSYIESQPVKLFEYMAAAIPVIAADFPKFREIVEGNRCGLCVPPCNIAAIASAIEWIFEHPDEAERMGERGREAVMKSLNWESEEQELIRLYERIVRKG